MSHGRRTLLLLGALTAAFCTQAQARTVKIISADTLELRRINEQELVIITGQAVELHVDDDVIKAKRVEFNRSSRTLTLVGPATYYNAKDAQSLSGDDLVVNLNDQQVSGQDVLISDSSIEIRGEEVERIPGQLKATGGYFTTCARCGRTPNDFAFKAERLLLYPGDRIVAYNAQLLLVDVPVLFIPVLVLPLNDSERQPKLEYDQDPTDGTTIKTDLPFSIGSNTLGTTLMRYYQNRDAHFGLGVSLRSYVPLPYIDRLDFYGLLNPRPVGAEGYESDYELKMTGRIPTELALRDIDYSLNINQRDIGRSSTDPERDVSRINFSAKADYPKFLAEIQYVGRNGPNPTTGLSTPLRQPEVTIDPKVYTNGNLSIDTRFSAGQYTGQSNPLSPSSVQKGLNISTSRLEEQHKINYFFSPWTDANVTFENTFTGRYYGTGARTVQLGLNAQLSQRFNTTNTFSVGMGYLRNEGTSPFAFDAIGGKLLSAPLTLILNTTPLPDVAFGIVYQRDFFREPQDQPATTFNLSVNRTPLSGMMSMAYRPYTQELDSFAYNFTLADPNADKLTLVPAVAAKEATATAEATPATEAYYRKSSAWPLPNLNFSASGGYTKSSGLTPFNVRANFSETGSSNRFSMYLVDDLKTPQLDDIGYNFNAANTDILLNPILLTLNEKINIPSSRLSGDATLTWNSRYRLSSSHDLRQQKANGANNNGTLNFTLGTTNGTFSGQNTNWQISYGGAYDLNQAGFTAPTLVGSWSTSQDGQRFGASATANLAGLLQQRPELVRVEAGGAWQLGTRVAGSGQMVYTRTRTGTYPNDIATDSLNLSPIKLNFSLGREGERPAAYLTTSLTQEFRWVAGEPQALGPITPVIGLTIDRCCWVIQAEANMVLKRYRLSISLPGADGSYPLFDLGPSGIALPLFSYQP